MQVSRFEKNNIPINVYIIYILFQSYGLYVIQYYNYVLSYLFFYHLRYFILLLLCKWCQSYDYYICDVDICVLRLRYLTTFYFSAGA